MAAPSQWQGRAFGAALLSGSFSGLARASEATVWATARLHASILGTGWL
jgi:hypothetical protein